MTGPAAAGSGESRRTSTNSFPAKSPFEDVVAAKLDLESLLERLPDPLDRTILVVRDEGYAIGKIADDLNRARDTIERRLRKIRRLYLELESEWRM